MLNECVYCAGTCIPGKAGCFGIEIGEHVICACGNCAKKSNPDLIMQLLLAFGTHVAAGRKPEDLAHELRNARCSIGCDRCQRYYEDPRVLPYRVMEGGKGASVFIDRQAADSAAISAGWEMDGDIATCAACVKERVPC